MIIPRTPLFSSHCLESRSESLTKLLVISKMLLEVNNLSESEILKLSDIDPELEKGS